MLRRKNRRSAFTLIELLLVLVIITVLATIVALNFNSIFGQSDAAKAKADIHQLSTALEFYRTQMKDFPNTLDGLVANPNNSPDWHGPYVQRGLPKDPWGHSYNYQYPGSHNTNLYDLWSSGDGKTAPIGLDNWTPDAGKN